MSDDEIINFIKTNLSKEYSSFIKLMMTFLALMKSNNLTNDEIRRKIPESKLSINGHSCINFFGIYLNRFIINTMKC